MASPAELREKVFTYLGTTSNRTMIPAAEVNDMFLDLAIDLGALADQEEQVLAAQIG